MKLTDLKTKQIYIYHKSEIVVEDVINDMLENIDENYEFTENDLKEFILSNLDRYTYIVPTVQILDNKHL